MGANPMIRLLLVLAISAVLGGCAGCDERDPTGLSGAVRIDGSSTVFPLSEAVAEEFMRDHPGVRVTVGASGTGGGFAKFVRGETDISDASRAIEDDEVEGLEAAGIEFVELPVAYDGIAVVVHPETDWVDCLTTAELEAIWEPGSLVQDLRKGHADRRVPELLDHVVGQQIPLERVHRRPGLIRQRLQPHPHQDRAPDVVALRPLLAALALLDPRRLLHLPVQLLDPPPDGALLSCGLRGRLSTRRSSRRAPCARTRAREPEQLHLVTLRHPL